MEKSFVNSDSRPSVKLDPAAVAKLRSVISPFHYMRGRVLLEGDPGYEDRRWGWNAMFDRRPAIIVMCGGTADVVEAVRFAREQRLETAVRCGGHSLAGFSTVEGGLIIDLSPMSSVIVDPIARSAVVQGGASLGNVDREGQVFGLTVPAGVVSETGVSGLTLGGGIGWTMRKYGLTIDNMLKCEVVTADGEVVTASETEHPDLFWGLRGGGGNFGIVTAFTFRVQPVGPTVLAGSMFWKVGARGPELLRKVRDILNKAPDELTSQVVLVRPPTSRTDLRADLIGQNLVRVSVCWVGDLDEGEKYMRVFKALEPDIDGVVRKSFVGHQSVSDGATGYGKRWYFKGGFLADMSDAVIDVCVKYCYSPDVPGPAYMEIYTLGGVVARVPHTATAFGSRQANYFYGCAGFGWTDPADDKAVMSWARGLAKALEPLSLGGSYANFYSDGANDVANVKSSFGNEVYERLGRVKAKYDPTNFFHINNNVLPAR